jgi:hypothetical protein
MALAAAKVVMDHLSSLAAPGRAINRGRLA